MADTGRPPPASHGQAAAGTLAAAPSMAAAPAPSPRARPAPQRPVLQGIGIGLVLLGAVVLGFAGYLFGLAGVQEARAQAILYTRLQQELAAEVAPLGPTAAGSPLAILDIPGIGVRDVVVVEGTSPENLTLGPGHVRDTPLPGQHGVAEIYGRRATFGAPFAHLAQLRAGQVIRVITGQGESTYLVAAVSDSRHQIVDPAPDRLILLTASSAAIPTYYTEVDAQLISTARTGAPPAPVITSAELPLASDAGGLALTMTWGLALLAVSAGGTVAAARWSPWAAYLATAPLVVAVLWNLYQGLAALLPNVY